MVVLRARHDVPVPSPALVKQNRRNVAARGKETRSLVNATRRDRHTPPAEDDRHVTPWDQASDVPFTRPTSGAIHSW